MQTLLQNALEKRSDLIKLILGAFILSISTCLIGNFLNDNYKKSVLLIAVLLALIVFIFLIYTFLGNCKNSITIEAIVPLDKECKCVYDIFRYEFSKKLRETLKAVFIENEAFKKIWEEQFESKNSNENELKKNKTIERNKGNEKEFNDNPVEYYSVVKVVGEEEKKTKSEKLLEEALEYIFIDELSLNLSSFFQKKETEDNILKEYDRNDFPKILLDNRIINMLSTPFSDRQIFSKIKMKPPDGGEIIFITGTDGSMYSRFNLVLPIGSKVSRIKDGHIRVENKRIVLDLLINYTKFYSNFPVGFQYNYLGIEKENLDSRKLIITLNAKIKPLSLLTNFGWEYHKWIDSFISSLEKFCSFEYFIKEIDWESNLTRIIISNQKEEIQNNFKKEKK
ncbi:MAG: hypothetical protein WC358_04290 [Ignavibacteria bacterium]|jgi:hypothetical protein